MKKLLLLLTSCAVTLLSLEMIIRKLDIAPRLIDSMGAYRLNGNPKTFYELVPGAGLDGSIINKQGFKDADFIERKDKNLIRIAMLGDSITEGMRIPLGKTFCDKLETLLNQENDHRMLRYEVMNFGVGGYNLEAEVETLRTKAVKYSPDIVVLNLAPNDNEPMPGMHLWFVYNNGLNEKQKLLIFKKYRSNFLVRKVLYKSKLYLFIMDRLSNIHNNSLALPRFINKYYLLTMNEQSRDAIYRNLYLIQQLQKRYGFKLLVCIHSVLADQDNINNKKFGELAGKIGFPYFYTNTYYKDSVNSPSELQLFEKDFCHLNELGHTIIAKAIFTELKKNGFIDNSL